MKKIHERSLRNTFQDNRTSFRKLFRQDNPMKVNQSNLYSPVTNFYKSKNDVALQMVKKLFELQEH